MLDPGLLRYMLSGRVAIACIGNQLRGDEAAGSEVARLLSPACAGPGRPSVIDCGETPENFIGVIAAGRPEKLIVIGAADFGGEPGAICILRRQELADWPLTTQKPRLAIITDYVESVTGAETFFVAIQPVSLEFGVPLGPAAGQAARDVAAAINEVVGRAPRR